jgi:hypothetical protein
MARDKSNSTNCEDDENSTLLTFIPQKPLQQDSCLSYNEMYSALGQPLSVPEEMALGYLSGYFFRKLLNYHKRTCDKCGMYGHIIDRAGLTTNLEQNEIFLYFKLYDTTPCTLYKCSEYFVSLIRCVIQVAKYCFDKYVEQPGFVNMVKMSVLTHLSELPQLCTSHMTTRLLSLVARTMLVYNIKWLNSTLRATKKFCAKKKTKAVKKLEKLSHV